MKVDKNFIKKGTFFKKSKFLKINFSIADNIHKNVLKMGPRQHLKFAKQQNIIDRKKIDFSSLGLFLQPCIV